MSKYEDRLFYKDATIAFYQCFIEVTQTLQTGQPFYRKFSGRKRSGCRCEFWTSAEMSADLRRKFGISAYLVGP
jgi:hypothetical protein